MTSAQLELYGSVAAELPRVCEMVDAQLASEDAYVRNLVSKIAHQRGKMLRPALVLLGAEALGECTDDRYILAAVAEMVHIASLVHDDVIDEADSRRNMPSLNRTVGNEGAVLLGDYVMSSAFGLCSSLKSPAAIQLLSNTCQVICEGELLQVAHRRNLELSEAEYLGIISKKTAALLRTCALFSTVLKDAPSRFADGLGRYGHSLGMAFQIADDMLDLVGSEEEMGKTLGRDMAKGELTLPLIRFLTDADGPARGEMMSAIRTDRPDSLGHIRRLLLDSDALDYCGQLAHGYTERALSALDDLPASAARDCLSALGEFVLSRRC